MNTIAKTFWVYIGLLFLGWPSVHAQTTSSTVTVYEGQYYCSQGPTQLTLVVLAPDYQGLQQAVFAFSPAVQNLNVPSGEFLMAGRVEIVANGILNLKQSRWIRQPYGFEMVDLIGRVSADGKTIQGKVITNGCTDFLITRVR